MLAAVADALVEALREHIQNEVGGHGAVDAPEYVLLADIASGRATGGEGQAFERLVVSLVDVTPDALIRSPLPAQPQDPAADAPRPVPLRARFLVSADYSDHELAIERIGQGAAGLSAAGVLDVPTRPPQEGVPAPATARVAVTLDDIDPDICSRLWLSLRTRRRPAFQIQVRLEE